MEIIMIVNGVEITEERLAALRAERAALREEYYDDALSIIGKDAVEQLRRFIDIYDENLYFWFAKLYDPEAGAFYYSESGRDYDGFLPDIESTVQAMETFGLAGLFSANGGYHITYAPDFLREKVISYVNSLEDPEDGYFYHKQWGKNIKTSRRGRDISWANKIYKFFEAEPPYRTALDRLADGKEEEKLNLPEHLTSVSKWRKYLRELDLSKESYWCSNLIQSQAPQIAAAGEEYINELAKYYEHFQKENGVWQDKVNFDSVNGLMKIMLAFNYLGIKTPRALKALDSAIEAATSDEEIAFCCQFYNPIVAINSLMLNMYKNGGKEVSEELRQVIIERAEEIINKTRARVLKCKKEDGSFSYLLTGSSYTSQAAYVAMPNTNEGDVNAATICSTGMVANACEMFAIPRVPIYCKGDSELFIELLRNAPKIEKKYPMPEFVKEWREKVGIK